MSRHYSATRILQRTKRRQILRAAATTYLTPSWTLVLEEQRTEYSDPIRFHCFKELLAENIREPEGSYLRIQVLAWCALLDNLRQPPAHQILSWRRRKCLTSRNLRSSS
jgi:hypothetical protein